jgi:hypothetical protein
VIDQFIDIRQRDDAVELRVFWKGFENGDASKEPYAAMLEDIPDIAALLFTICIKDWDTCQETTSRFSHGIAPQIAALVE